MGMKIVNQRFDFDEEDILAGKYTAWELMQPIWYSVDIYDSFDKYQEDLKKFSDAQGKLLALFWYEAEVGNGGHDQFFSNSTGIVWKDALEALRLIGADEYADNFQKAIAMFGGSVPFDREARNLALEALYEGGNSDVFHSMDMFFYDYEECDLEQLMDDYVKSHAAEFAVHGEYPYSVRA